MADGARNETVRRLVQEHYESVYRFAFRLSGRAADAEDLTQQAFLTACRKLDQLRRDDRARPWLLAIVRNAFLKSRQQQNSELTGWEGELTLPAQSGIPESIDEERLQAALDEMPEAFRTPVLLYYFEDISYREIAEVLNVPLGTVMSRLARGKDFLRQRLAEPESAAAAPRPNV